MVGCGCGVGVENVITMTACPDRSMGGGSVMVSWCGAGSVIITEQHSLFAVAE